MVESWLKAVGVEVEDSKIPGCDLTVRHRDGSTLQVQVAISHQDPLPMTQHIRVLACELTSPHFDTAHFAFHTITRAAGFGTPFPLNRGIEPKGKLGYEDNFELVSFRHREFRRVTNPSAEELASYRPVIRRSISRFVRINDIILRRHGLVAEDLESYCLVWTCNFLGLHRLRNGTQLDNELVLGRYLKQRFTEFARMLVKKERNCIPDRHTAQIARYGVPVEMSRDVLRGSYAVEQFIETTEGTPEEVQEVLLEAEVDGVEFQAVEAPMVLRDEPSLLEPDHDSDVDDERESLRSEARRRKAAKAMLADQLGRLGHAKMIETLEFASTNLSLCVDAQKEARRQLQLHRRACAECRLQVDEQGVVGDAAR